MTATLTKHPAGTQQYTFNPCLLINPTKADLTRITVSLDMDAVPETIDDIIDMGATVITLSKYTTVTGDDRIILRITTPCADTVTHKFNTCGQYLHTCYGFGYSYPDHWTLCYVDGKPARVCRYADQYAQPTGDHDTVPIDKALACGLMVFARPTSTTQDTPDSPVAQYRLNLPHTLDGIPGMLQPG